MFKNAKVGDKVWSMMWGWGKIVQIRHQNKYPIEVEFIDDNCCSYTYGGKYNVKDASQTLFWQKFKIPEEAYIKPLSKLEVDTKVLVWQKGETEKHKRYFSHFDWDMIYCFGSGSSSWNSNGLTTHWSN